MNEMRLEELRKEKRRIVGFDYWDMDSCKEAVIKDGLNIQFVDLQTARLAMIAVKHEGTYLQYVREKLRTSEICLKAVSLNGFALAYVVNQTPEICKAAVAQDKLAIMFVKDLSMLD